MKPEELTVEEVRNELQILIDKYPNRKGTVPIVIDGSTQNTCVYYKNQFGSPICPTTEGHFDFDTALIEPVCIVGEWIESFHPEFKTHKQVVQILIRNQGIGSARGGFENPFSIEVRELLGRAQAIQDGVGTTWGMIKV